MKHEKEEGIKQWRSIKKYCMSLQNSTRIKFWIILLIVFLGFVFSKLISTKVIKPSNETVFFISDILSTALLMLFLFIIAIRSEKIKKKKLGTLIVIVLTFLLIETINTIIRNSIRIEPVLSILVGAVFCFLYMFYQFKLLKK